MSKNIENRYVVDSDAKVVVCHREVKSGYIANEVRKKCSRKVARLVQWLVRFDELLPFEVEIPKKYKGVAKCDERDTFDVKVGRDVARLIAKKKHHAAAIRTYKRLYTLFIEAATEMGNLALQHNKDLQDTEATLEKYKA